MTALDKCSVCGSANLNHFVEAMSARASVPRDAFWCEDCGSMHTDMGVSSPEKSMLHHQVLAFHKRFGQSIGEKPRVVDGKTLRFRLSLVAEEFFEALEAALAPHEASAALQAAHAETRICIEQLPADLQLDKFVDALADLMYVIEGAAITMGVNMTPILAEVQKSNMAKLPSYVAAKDATHNGHVALSRCWRCGAFLNEQGNTAVTDSNICGEGVGHERACPICPTRCVSPPAFRREDGKIQKPPGWKPPDIEGELRAQGWLDE